MGSKVAVVGAGALGLMQMKNLKDDGFDVTGYEARDFVGGLWNYSEDEYLSVAESTVFNSSRYRSAITDFPFPEETSDFPTWQEMHKYLNDYCDKFDLRSRIKLNTKATGLRRDGGKWGLEVAPKNGEPRVDYFDKIVVSIGSFVKPKKPRFDGIDLFEGTAVHAIDYHKPSQYKDKNVLMIGLHATSQDVAVSLSRAHASKIYISHRNGLVLFPRYTQGHAAFDQSQSLNFFFFQVFMSAYFPNLYNWLIDKAIISISKKAYPKIPKSWNFSPAPSISVTPPLIADEVYPLLESGYAIPCAEVMKITGPKIIELADGTILYDIDAIIYCTGYDMAVPFIPPEFNPYPVIGEPPLLYRNIFPINKDPAIRDSLAFLGQAAIAFPGFVQHEIIGMAVSQVFLGKTQLPSYSDMQAWRKGYLAWRAGLISRQKIKSTFYVAFMPMADHFRWLDEVAGTGMFEHFGWWSAKAWGFWWRDRALYRKCKSGLFSPAMWRLFDTGRRKVWSQARQQIFEDNETAERQVRQRKEAMEKGGKKD